MNLNTELCDKINYECSSLMSTRILIETGVFSSRSHACALRERGTGPKFFKHINGAILYTKQNVLDWLKNNPIFARERTNLNTGEISHSITIRIAASVLRKLSEKAKKEGGYRTLNKWISSYINEQFKCVVAPPPKEAPLKVVVAPPSKEAPRATKKPIVTRSQPKPNPGSKFLTMKLFTATYPSFPLSFFKRMLRGNPDFVKKVMVKNGYRYFVNVKAFWKFLEDLNKPQGRGVNS